MSTTEHAHQAGPRTYLVIGAFLVLLTVMEVAVFYIPALARVLVPVLLLLATAKFALVAMYYMHLRFDHRWFSYMFVGPLAAMFFIGMFQPRCTARSVWPAVILGLTVSVLWSWGDTIFGTSDRPTVFLSIAVPCATTFVAAAVLSLFVDRRRTAGEEEYSWPMVIRTLPAEPKE